MLFFNHKICSTWFLDRVVAVNIRVSVLIDSRKRSITVFLQFQMSKLSIFRFYTFRLILARLLFIPTLHFSSTFSSTFFSTFFHSLFTPDSPPFFFVHDSSPYECVQMSDSINSLAEFLLKFVKS